MGEREVREEMLEEMVMCGNVVETNKQIVIAEASKAIDVQRDGGFPM